MQRLLFVGLLASILLSCDKSKLVVSEIRTLELEYSPGTDLNFGSRFEARVKAHMLNGDEIDITSHRKFDFNSTDINKYGGQFTIVRRPMSFDENFVSYSLQVTDKEESFVLTDTLLLNFRGGISVWGEGEDGQNGTDQKDKGSPWLFRDGKPGEHGTPGGTGGNGSNLDVHIWKEGAYYYIHIIRREDLFVSRYKTLATAPIVFNVSGGNGGRGGNGGNGSDGRDGEKDEDGKYKRVGSGGNGGDGGDGGNGGNGGMIHVTIHPNASEIAAQLTFQLDGGSAGDGGRGGTAGKAGQALTGQNAASPGAQGRQGRRGSSGGSGTANTESAEFNPSDFK